MEQRGIRPVDTHFLAHGSQIFYAGLLSGRFFFARKPVELLSFRKAFDISSPQTVGQGGRLVLEVSQENWRRVPGLVQLRRARRFGATKKWC